MVNRTNKIGPEMNKEINKMKSKEIKTLGDVAKSIDVAKELENSYNISLTDEQKRQLKMINDRLIRYFLLNHPEKLG